MGKKKVTIALGGAKGVGKTTLANSLKKKRPFIKIFNYGLILKKLANSYHFQPFEKLSVKVRNRLREKSADYILKQMESVNLIDLHFGEFEDGGYHCVLPKKLIPKITHFVLIAGDFKKIKERRLEDIKQRRTDDCSIRLNILGEDLLFKQLTQKNQVKKIKLNNDNINIAAERLLQFLTPSL